MNQRSKPDTTVAPATGEAAAGTRGSWSAHQLACLAELGIPVWHYAPAQDAAPGPKSGTSGHQRQEPTEQTKPQPQPEQTQSEPAQAGPKPEAEQIPVIYQLHIWYLAFPELPPAGLYPWLNDLARAFDSSPVQVKQPAEVPLVDCAPYTKATLSPAEKRNLWEAMKAAARQAGRDW